MILIILQRSVRQREHVVDTRGTRLLDEPGLKQPLERGIKGALQTTLLVYFVTCCCILWQFDVAIQKKHGSGGDTRSTFVHCLA